MIALSGKLVWVSPKDQEKALALYNDAKYDKALRFLGRNTLLSSDTAPATLAVLVRDGRLPETADEALANLAAEAPQLHAELSGLLRDGHKDRATRRLQEATSLNWWAAWALVDDLADKLA
ncbi:hypothetical protein [Spirillospora sp. CA-294931]|uniref:hypothetical protein n=1 Tax=Spirillospora sp. CA-294931 TaxID=3240042 RepID=UPI003D8BBFA8